MVQGVRTVSGKEGSVRCISSAVQYGASFNKVHVLSDYRTKWGQSKWDVLIFGLTAQGAMA